EKRPRTWPAPCTTLTAKTNYRCSEHSRGNPASQSQGAHRESEARPAASETHRPGNGRVRPVAALSVVTGQARERIRRSDDVHVQALSQDGGKRQAQLPLRSAPPASPCSLWCQLGHRSLDRAGN